MHRQNLLNKLNEYTTRWPQEGLICGRFLDFVRNYPDCFERSLEIGHVTGSAWLLDATGEQVLLTHHRKLDAWLQLGGHADGNPDVLQVALDEAHEESGLQDIMPVSEQIFDIDIHVIPKHREVPEHLHYDVRYMMQARGDLRFKRSNESIALSWVALEKMPSFTQERSMLRMVEKTARSEPPHFHSSFTTLT